MAGQNSWLKSSCSSRITNPTRAEIPDELGSHRTKGIPMYKAPPFRVVFLDTPNTSRVVMTRPSWSTLGHALHLLSFRLTPPYDPPSSWSLEPRPSSPKKPNQPAPPPLFPTPPSNSPMFWVVQAPKASAPRPSPGVSNGADTFAVRVWRTSGEDVQIMKTVGEPEVPDGC